MTVHVVNQANTDISVKGDSDQLRQVFNNLIENGIKYGAQGGNVTVTLSQPAYLPGLRSEGIEVTVSDDGPALIPFICHDWRTVLSHRQPPFASNGRHGVGACHRETYH